MVEKEQGEKIGDPCVSWGESQDGSAPIDIVILGDCVGVRYGQITIVFRGSEEPDANE